MDEDIKKEEILVLQDSKMEEPDVKKIEMLDEDMKNEEVLAPQALEQSLTKRTEFSSENFKIEVKHLPKFFGVGQMKKLLENKLQVKYHR